MSHDHMEARLRVLDLQWAVEGDHLEDEALAEIVEGRTATEAEAAHLATCDECAELLIALGAGLEAMVAEIPETAASLPTIITALSDEGPRPAVGSAPSGAPTAPTDASPVPLRRSPRRRARRHAALLWVALAVAGVAYASHQLWLPLLTGPAQPQQPTAPSITPAPARPAPAEAITPPAEAAPEATPEAPAPAQAPSQPPVDYSQDWPALPQLSGLEPLSVRPEGPTLEISPPALAARPAPPPRHRARRPQRDDETGVRLEGVSLGPRRVTQRPGPTAPISGPPKAWGNLRLNSKPPSRVFIDGKARGWTPIVDLRLQEGPHDVRLEYEHPRAKRQTERFRVVIPPDKTWSISRDNLGPSAGHSP